MTPQQYVQQKASSSGSSFYYAFLFLPKDRRAAITAFYAFCREVDDVVDEVNDPSVAAQKLSWWRAEVTQSFSGAPTHPVMKALMPWCTSFGIESHHLLSVIEGCEMDLVQTRYIDFQSLSRYCHLVASVVGEVSSLIFGSSSAQTTQYAHKLGLAFQLTNIIRDVGEDALRGRIYIPINDLQEFGVKAHEILQRVHSDRFERLMQFQCDRAKSFYEEALSTLPAQDKRAQKPGLMMASIYSQLLSEIEKSHFPVLRERVALTPLRKFWLAWRVQALGRF
jgi:phytoene synthase